MSTADTVPALKMRILWWGRLTKKKDNREINTVNTSCDILLSIENSLGWQRKRKMEGGNLDNVVMPD